MTLRPGIRSIWMLLFVCVFVADVCLAQERSNRLLEKRQQVLALLNEASALRGELDAEQLLGKSSDIRNFASLGFFEEAIDLLDSDEPTHIGEASNLVRQYAEQSRFDEALIALDRIESKLGLVPENAGWRSQTIRYCLYPIERQKNTVQAIRFLEQINRALPGGKDEALRHSIRIARIFIDSGDPEAGLQLVKKFEDPLSPATINSLVSRAIQEGHLEWAKPLIAGSAGLKPSMLRRYAEKLIARREYSEAMETAIEIAELVPTSGGQILSKAALYSKDVDLIENAWSIMGSNPSMMSRSSVSQLTSGFLQTGQIEKAFEVINRAGGMNHLPYDAVFRDFFDVFQAVRNAEGRMAALDLFVEIELLWMRVRFKLAVAEALSETDQKQSRELLLEVVEALPSIDPEDLKKQYLPDYCDLLIDRGRLEDAVRVLEWTFPEGHGNHYRRKIKFRIAAKWIEHNQVDKACEVLRSVETDNDVDVDILPTFSAIAKQKGVTETMDLAESVSSSEIFLDYAFKQLVRDGHDEIARGWLTEMHSRSPEETQGDQVRLANMIKGERSGWQFSGEELRRLESVFAGMPELQLSVVIVWAGRGRMQPAIEFCKSHSKWLAEEIDSKQPAESLMTRLVDARLLPDFLKWHTTEKPVFEIPDINFYRARNSLLAGDTDQAIKLSKLVDNPLKRRGVLIACARQLESPWLESLRRIDSWLVTQLVDDGNGRLSILDLDASKGLYDGLPGIAIFYHKLSSATSDTRYRLMRQRLVYSMKQDLNELTAADDPGLFTGYTGIAHAIFSIERSQGSESFLKVVDWLAESAIEVPNQAGVYAVTWNNSTDQISGAAGIGHFLNEFYIKHPKRNALLIAAGESLLAQATNVELKDGSSGLKWNINDTMERELPNYSHGTAGVCRFLLELHKTCKTLSRGKSTPELGLKYDNRFGNAALAGARYLAQLNSENGQRSLLPHHLPAEGELFYMSWCHGPPGTCQLANAIADVKRTSNVDEYWAEYSKTASETLLRAALHKNRTDGFWDNVGICCGSAGVGSFLLDQSIRLNDKRLLEEAKRIANDIIARGESGVTDDGGPTLCWPSAEHRVRPDLIETQPGLMQGAAGVGLFLVQLEYLQRHRSTFSIFEDLF